MHTYTNIHTLLTEKITLHAKVTSSCSFYHLSCNQIHTSAHTHALPTNCALQPPQLVSSIMQTKYIHVYTHALLTNRASQPPQLVSSIMQTNTYTYAHTHALPTNCASQPPQLVFAGICTPCNVYEDSYTRSTSSSKSFCTLGSATIHLSMRDSQICQGLLQAE
jgi:hypothetical protein